MFLPNGPVNQTIFVYDDEPSSIISYALSSLDYNKHMDTEDNTLSEQQYDSSEDEGEDSEEEEFARSAVEQHMTSKDNNHFKLMFNRSNESMSDSESGNQSARATKKRTEFFCTFFFAKQFAALRKAYCNGDDSFIHSLSRCNKFTPTGGKSKSTFTKTWDDRFVLKEISRVELLTFLETGPDYFDYMVNALFHQLPTLLMKILGVFRIAYTSKGKQIKQDIIVMENLFYGRNIDKTFDLKGSLRNRYQKTMGAVLLDENLLENMSAGNPPLITRPLSKRILTTSIHNDTLFLSKLNVMDYSLLVGVEEDKDEIVVGIIDYVRQYTWDKHLETWVKSAGIMSSKGKGPTVISPKLYKGRFREAMDRYFLLTPDKFTGLLQLN
jgi:1-phosphatidylinositol-3-phosphate 5-kinase